MKIVLLGSGNVATHLARALRSAGHHIVEVYSPTYAHAALLAGEVGATAVSDIAKINPTAALYLFSLKDDALPGVIGKMPHTEGVWAHTAGSLPMDLFSSRSHAYGVIYPLQTFSKRRTLPLADIPLFIEGSNPATLLLLEELALSISPKVYPLSGEKRAALHLAAVFACNFVNHLYALSAAIVNNEEMPFEILLPLIGETAAKVGEMAPGEAQTGPAVRHDEKVMQQHLAQISNPQMREIYLLLSKSIQSL